MIVSSIVKYSDTPADLRIDADFFRPELLNYEDIIKKGKNEPIESIAWVSDGNHLKISDKFGDSGIRYLRGQDLSSFYVSDSNPIYVPRSEYKKLKRSHIKERDVLIGIVGTIGTVSFVTDKYDDLTGNCKIAIVRAKNIVPEYLAAFLISKIGNSLLMRQIRGSVQTGIILPDIKKLRVPIVTEENQLFIKKIIDDSVTQDSLSRSLLAEAEGMLLAELGLDSLKLPSAKWNVRDFSETRSEERIDGEYYLPKYYALREAINNSKYGGAPLLGKAHHKKTMIRPKAEKNYKYIELADIDQSLGTVGELEEIPGVELPSRARMALKARNVVISSVEGSIDKVALIPEDLNDAVGSTGFFVFEEREYTAELLLVLLRTRLVKDQFLREARGTILTAVNQGSLDNIVVPVVPEPLMNSISAKVRDSHSARAEAKRLLEEAKRKVEEMILNEGKELML